jgi:hypothetical protein
MFLLVKPVWVKPQVVELVWLSLVNEFLQELGFTHLEMTNGQSLENVKMVSYITKTDTAL